MKARWESMTKEEHDAEAAVLDHPVSWPRAWHHREHVSADSRRGAREDVVAYGRVQSPTPNT